jgi:hypothetical protein
MEKKASKFISDVKKIKDLDETNLNNAIEKHYSEMTKNNNTLGAKMMTIAKHIATLKYSETTYLNNLKELLRMLKIAYPNIYSLRAKLSEIRTKVIKPSQTENIYKKSMLDSYFNIEKEDRDKVSGDYKKKIKASNRDRIQLNQRDIFEKMKTLILSNSTYDRAIALMLSIGARPVELFAMNEYSLAKKPGWIRVDNIAKKRESQKNRGETYTDRPTIIFSPQFVIDNVAKLRKSMGDVLNTEGKLKTNINNTLNKHVIRAFPFLSSEDIHNKATFLRKIYADLSYKLYANRDKVNYNAWISDVLGHSKSSDLTSFSYSYVNVKGSDDSETLEELRQKVEEVREAVKNINENPNEYARQAKNRALAMSRPAKWALLEEIYALNPTISHDKLRAAARAGSRIVSEFLRSKRQPTEEE